MWYGNTLFQEWCAGKPIGQSILSPEELINIFSLMIASGSLEVIKAIWNENESLYQAIRNLNIDQSMLLIKEMMSNYRKFGCGFVNLFLKCIEDVDVLDKIKAEFEVNNVPTSLYYTKQIKMLAARI